MGAVKYRRTPIQCRQDSMNSHSLSRVLPDAAFDRYSLYRSSKYFEVGDPVLAPCSLLSAQESSLAPSRVQGPCSWTVVWEQGRGGKGPSSPGRGSADREHGVQQYQSDLSGRSAERPGIAGLTQYACPVRILIPVSGVGRTRPWFPAARASADTPSSPGRNHLCSGRSCQVRVRPGLGLGRAPSRLA
jgi:hypothetical protein